MTKTNIPTNTVTLKQILSEANVSGLLIVKESYAYEDFTFAVLDGFLYHLDHTLDEIRRSEPCGIVVTTAKGNPVIIKCGDNEFHNPLVASSELKAHPTTSFYCLSLLINSQDKIPVSKRSKDALMVEVADKLADHSLAIIDYVPDSTRKIDPKQRKIVKKNSAMGRRLSKDVNVPLGYTIMYSGNQKYHFHRSSTIIARYQKKTFLLGQDEGTFFGVELPSNVRTVNEALTALIPDGVKGKKYVRQGEWFMIPVAQNKLPKFKDREVEFQTLILPRDSEDSHQHLLDGMSGFVSKNRIYARNFSLSHDEHETVRMNGWSAFYKNTAVRSVSIEGVD